MLVNDVCDDIDFNVHLWADFACEGLPWAEKSCDREDGIDSLAMLKFVIHMVSKVCSLILPTYAFPI